MKKGNCFLSLSILALGSFILLGWQTAYGERVYQKGGTYGDAWSDDGTNWTVGPAPATSSPQISSPAQNTQPIAAPTQQKNTAPAGGVDMSMRNIAPPQQSYSQPNYVSYDLGRGNGPGGSWAPSPDKVVYDGRGNVTETWNSRGGYGTQDYTATRQVYAPQPSQALSVPATTLTAGTASIYTNHANHNTAPAPIAPPTNINLSNGAAISGSIPLANAINNPLPVDRTAFARAANNIPGYERYKKMEGYSDFVKADLLNPSTNTSTSATPTATGSAPINITPPSTDYTPVARAYMYNQNPQQYPEYKSYEKYDDTPQYNNYVNSFKNKSAGTGATNTNQQQGTAGDILGPPDTTTIELRDVGDGQIKRIMHGNNNGH